MWICRSLEYIEYGRNGYCRVICKNKQTIVHISAGTKASVKVSLCWDLLSDINGEASRVEAMKKYERTCRSCEQTGIFSL